MQKLAVVLRTNAIGGGEVNDRSECWWFSLKSLILFIIPLHFYSSDILLSSFYLYVPILLFILQQNMFQLTSMHFQMSLVLCNLSLNSVPHF